MYLCIINCPSITILLFYLALVVQASAQVQTAWINEVHYDNTGGDVNEFVEIAYNNNKETTTSLLGWKVVFYNGSNGLQYGRVVLDSSIISSSASSSSPLSSSSGTTVQFLKVPKSGIQNSKEGIALIDKDDNLVQFLSYEGTVAALDGPAAGSISIDIGVSESSSTTGVGQSLQLTGIGCSYSDFTWESDRTESGGNINTDQTIFCNSSEAPNTSTYTETRHYSAFSLELLCNTTANAGYATRFTYQLVGPDITNEKRKSSFYYDNLLPTLPQSCQQTSRSSYKHSHCGRSGRNKNPYCYDRGHLVMANHLDNDAQDIYESNIMTNILPQATGFNQVGGAWRKIEDIIECARDIPDVTKQTIFGGALYTDSTNDYFLDSHGIPTPDLFWKIVVREFNHGFSPEVAAYILPNVYDATDDRLDSDYLKTIAAVKALSGDAMPELPETYSERESSWSIPPGCDKS